MKNSEAEYCKMDNTHEFVIKTGESKNLKACAHVYPSAAAQMV